MLYGIRKDDVTTMVVGIANNNYAALEQWYRHLQDDTDLVINVYETNFMDRYSSSRTHR
jgi:nicotinic acid phosphoribosyltransferase